jgi:hypothetical protein
VNVTGLAGYLLIAGVRADFSDKLCRTAKQTIGNLCLRIRANQEKMAVLGFEDHPEEDSAGANVEEGSGLAWW